MKENFYIVIETMHYGDAGVTENVTFLQIFSKDTTNSDLKFTDSRIVTRQVKNS